MHILHVFKNYLPLFGGVECHLNVLARHQVEAGHRVDILTATDQGWPAREEQDSIRIRRCRTWFTLASTPVAPALPIRLLLHRAEIVHLHFPYPWADFWSPLIQAKPVVLTYHSDILLQTRLLPFYRPFLRRILRRADRILCTSPNYLASSSLLQAWREKCRIIPLGVDLQRFQPSLRGPDCRLRVLFVGRIRPYKGLEILLQAAESLPQVQLVIVGDGIDTVEASRALSRLKAEKRVEILGAASESDLPAIYQSADLLVLPSINRSEAFGLVLLEAMASGLPCITTELHTGTSWIVQHGKTGRVVAPADPAGLAAAIRSLQKDPEQRKSLGQAGRRRVEERFGSERMATATLQVYQELLKG